MTIERVRYKLGLKSSRTKSIGQFACVKLRILCAAFVTSTILTILSTPYSSAQTSLPNCPTNKGTFKTQCVKEETFQYGTHIVEFQNNLPLKTGKIIWNSGATYEGEIRDHFPDGYGIRRWPDGQTEEGIWLKGEMTGKYKISYPSGNVYTGEVVRSELRGNGNMVYKNGSIYEGNFASNVRNGYGRIQFADGNFYAGEFKADKFHGFGTLVLGLSMYVGEFSDGIPNGSGTAISLATNRKFSGQYVNGKPDGYGIRSFANGEKYIGYFKEGEYNGEGVFYAKDGTVLQSGNWAMGVFKSGDVKNSSPALTTSRETGLDGSE